MRLEEIPPRFYQDYRIDVMFDCYKWDLQAGEQSTISPKVLLLDSGEAGILKEYAVNLYNETIAMERILHKNPALAIETGISRQMAGALCDCAYNPEKHVRFMRFDFHPTADGWRVSEVNSDVPAGWPEASVLPALAEKYFDGYFQYGSFGEVIKNKLEKLIPRGSIIAYLHDTHTVEDYQIMRYLGDLMEKSGYQSMYASPEHIQFENNRAVIDPPKRGDCDTVNAEKINRCRNYIGGIVRYFPIEWIEFIQNADWRGFIHTETPSCNHPIALLTQSKRLPLIWEKLGIPLPYWKKLLPETKCVTDLISRDGWILKPAFGRVGEGINIAVSKQEEAAIVAAAYKEPTQWVAQRFFNSTPYDGLHINIGVFVADGEFAGFYARLSTALKIDESASEIPILVKQ